MAQKVTITHVSDISGEALTDQDFPGVEFSWLGKSYTVDLTKREFDNYAAVIAELASKATPARGGKSKAPKAVSGGPSAKEVRAWATENGHEVPERGRIPAEVREAYDAAH